MKKHFAPAQFASGFRKAYPGMRISEISQDIWVAKGMFCRWTNLVMARQYARIFTRCVMPLLLVMGMANGADIAVRGKVTTAYGPVKFCSVRFVVENDTLTRFTALTDTLGNYRIDIHTGVSATNSQPVRFALEQNYPNPFSSATSIRYHIHQQTNASVRIYNILGQLVKDFQVGLQTSGVHSIVWDGTDNARKRVTPGVYFYQLTGEGESLVRKMLYGGGNSNLDRGTIQGSEIGKRETNIVRGLSVGYQSYTVLLQTTDSTSPPIEAVQFKGVSISTDTVLNFTANESDDFVLCYSTWVDDDRIQVFLNNVKGTHPRNISNYADNDEYPDWSPNGRYVVFWRSVGIFGPLTYVYDLQNQTYANLTTDGGISGSSPHWSPNGMTYFAYEKPLLAPEATYIMNPDGTGKKKMLDTVATDGLFFYEDSYRFVFVQRARVYRSDIDRTSIEFVCDLEQLLGQFVPVQGFNPNTEELLITYKSPVDSLDRVATFSIKTHLVKDLLTADVGYNFFQITYSADWTKIALIEDSDQDEFLSVLEAGTKRRLIRILNPFQEYSFSFEPMRFSPDGRYVAFSEQEWHRGQYVYYIERLYVVDVEGGTSRSLGEGWYPSWKQRP